MGNARTAEIGAPGVLDSLATFFHACNDDNLPREVLRLADHLLNQGDRRRFVRAELFMLDAKAAESPRAFTRWSDERDESAYETSGEEVQSFLRPYDSSEVKSEDFGLLQVERGPSGEATAPKAMVALAVAEQIAGVLVLHQCHDVDRGELVDLGRVLGALVEVRRAIGARRLYELRTQKLFDVLPLGAHIYGLNEDGRLIFEGANPAADRILHVANAQFLGKAIEDAFPSLPPAIIAKYEETARTGKDYHFEQIFYDDGRIVGAYDVYAGPLAPTRMVALFQDITERRRHEETLRKTSAALEQCPNGVVITSSEGEIQYVNPAFSSMMGLAPSDVLGAHPLELQFVADKPEREKRMLEKLRYGEVYREEVLLHRNDGTRFWGRVAVAPVKDESGRVSNYVAIQEDITAERALTEQLAHVQRLDAIGSLSGGIAHDFNNLLTVIMGNLEWLSVQLEDKPDVLTCIEDTLQASRRGGELTKRLLAFSKRQPLRASAVDLDDVVERVIRLIERSAPPSLRIEHRRSRTRWLAKCDIDQMEHALLNLALNAVESSPDGGELVFETDVLNVTHGRPGLPSGEYVTVAIVDSGRGMTPDVLARACEPFFSTKQDVRGTGLGLSVVYGFVRQSGGHLAIQSQPGVGTRVTVHMPRAKDGTPVTVGQPNLGRELKGTALVVDDDPGVRRVTVMSLERLGYTVISAEDALAAVRLVDEGTSIDVLVSDVVMPGMSGPQLTRQLRVRWPMLPVILISGYAYDVFEREGGPELDVQLLPKPFTIDQLADALQRAVEAPSAVEMRSPVES